MANGLRAIFFALVLIGCASCASSVKVNKDTSGTSDNLPWDSCSYEVGGHACNFILRNQYDEEVSLYDFYGNTVVIDFSAMWCGPCRTAAKEVQEVKDEAGSRLTYLTVLIDDLQGQSPNPEDCRSWSDAHGILEPVLAGNRSLIDTSGENGWPITGWPTFFFITEDMVIHSTLKGFGSAQVDQLISEAMSAAR